MAKKKKGLEGFDDWYEENGSRDQEAQSSGPARIQSFDDWYNAGANEPYTTLRFIANDTARRRSSGSAPEAC